MSILNTGLAFVAGGGIAAIAAFFLFGGADSGHATASGHAVSAPPMQVPVTPIVKKTVPVYLEYVGTTDAIRSVILQAQVTGYLKKRAVADGSDVASGTLLYQIDQGPYQAALDQAKAQEQKDAAALAYAQASRHRNQVMRRTGDVSLDTLQQSTSAEQQDNAALAADRASIETARINLGYTDIRAPFAGRLSLSQVYEGALISVAGTQLNTLVQLDPIYATFAPPDRDLAEIETYQAKGAIPTEVIVGNGDQPQYHGKLTFLDNSVGRGTGTVTLRSTIENPNHKLLPGQYVRVRLHVTDRPDVLLAPQIAVNSSQLGQYLDIVGPGNKIEQHYVTLGANDGSLVAITKGATAGESVVVGDLFKIGPGMVVQPVPAQPAELTASAGDSR